MAILVFLRGMAIAHESAQCGKTAGPVTLTAAARNIVFFHIFAVMKKSITTIVAIIVMALAVSQMVSCEKYILPELTVTPDTLRFGAAADSALVKVHSNVIWSNKDNPDWIGVSVDWGDADAETFVSVTENTSTQARQAQVSIKSETIQRYVVVEQAGATAQEPQP